MSEPINVLSLFDGISCGQLALHRAGIDVSAYFASEIDTHAIKVTQKNFPNTIQCGAVCNIVAKDLPKIDLIIGGTPCQGFSFSGKGLAFDDPRSKLFFEFVRILNEVRQTNPNVHFLLENVRMKKQHEDVITQYLGVSPITINSSLVSAQNRVRLYWTNIGLEICHIFGLPKSTIEQPVDRGILLSDIIQSGVVDRDKGYCIDANYWKGTNVEQYIKKARRQLVFEPTAFTETRSESAKEIRREYRKKYGRDFSPRRAKELVPRVDGKMNCLTATYSLKEHTIIDESVSYRTLTPIEAERCQTLPDGYTEGISKTQRFRSIGNGWTVDVIAHIFSYLPYAKKQ